MESRFCPHCEREVPVELSKHTGYILHVCSICGLGLQVSPIPLTDDQSNVRRGLTGKLASDSTDDSTTNSVSFDPSQSMGGALAQLKLLRKSQTLQPVVERSSARTDTRSSDVGLEELQSLSTNYTPIAQRPYRPSLINASNSAQQSSFLGNDESSESPFGDKPTTQVLSQYNKVQVPMPKEQPPAEPKQSIQKILLIEPNDILRSVCKVLLIERQHVQYVTDKATASDGLEAYMRACIEGDRPDLVIQEMQFADMKGTELAYAYRGIEKALGVPHVPILFFASEPLSDDQRAILQEIKRVRFIKKPSGSVEADDSSSQAGSNQSASAAAAAVPAEVVAGKLLAAVGKILEG